MNYVFKLTITFAELDSWTPGAFLSFSEHCIVNWNLNSSSPSTIWRSSKGSLYASRICSYNSGCCCCCTKSTSSSLLSPQGRPCCISFLPPGDPLEPHCERDDCIVESGWMTNRAFFSFSHLLNVLLSDASHINLAVDYWFIGLLFHISGLIYSKWVLKMIPCPAGRAIFFHNNGPVIDSQSCSALRAANKIPC